MNNQATSSKTAQFPLGSLVEDESSAISFATELLAASQEVFSDITKWNELAQIDGVSIEAASARGPRGPFQSSVIRTSIPLGGISPRELYDFIISPAGYAFIDPDADPNDFGKALMGPFPVEGGSAQVEYASLALPFPLADRDCIVTNAFLHEARTFLSASCYSPELSKEASPYDDAPCSTTTRCCGKVRMTFYGAYFVDEAAADGSCALKVVQYSCVLKVVQYIDMNGWTPIGLNNQANLTCFKSFVDRVQKRFPVPSKGSSKKLD